MNFLLLLEEDRVEAWKRGWGAEDRQGRHLRPLLSVSPFCSSYSVGLASTSQIHGSRAGMRLACLPVSQRTAKAVR